jgi:branched-chain amino acid transport system permease protein
MLTLDLALAGLGIGSIASLSGLGFLVTYRITGVFNLAFGATGMAVAFLLWQQVRVWHWPVGVAAVLDLLIVCPVFGMVLERLVFRPLQKRSASPAERLVASLGVLVLLLGVATLVWGAQARLDAPSLVPDRRLNLPGGGHVPLGTVVDLAVIALVGLGLVAGQRTMVGLRVRAVVERRELAEVLGVDANRVSALGWALGSTLAGLAGVLLAPTLRLEPYGFTLVMLETLAVVVVARLTNPWRAVVAGVAVGVVQAELARVHLQGHARVILQAVTSNLFVVALLGAVFLVRRLEEIGGTDAGATARLATRGDVPSVYGWWLVPAMTLAAPLLFGAQDLRIALAVPALAIMLVSIVVVSGYSGQISLGQAGFAGLGALVAGRLAAGTMPGMPQFPGVAVLVVAPLVVAPVGLLFGWPAIRRRGLFLALTTFALGVAMNRFMFEQPSFTNGVEIHPPAAFGSDNNFYILELICLAAAFLVVRNLHHGRLGRALIAVRDDEAGALASGVDVGRLKLVVFAVSAALAALGGALLAMGAHAFDAGAFDPIRGLIWFAAVVVFGIDSAPGAVIGAGLLVGLDAGLPSGTSTLVVGCGAVLLGRLPGGLLSTGRRLIGQIVGGLTSRSAPAPSVRAIRLTPTGRAVAASARRRTRRPRIEVMG